MELCALDAYEGVNDYCVWKGVERCSSVFTFPHKNREESEKVLGRIRHMACLSVVDHWVRKWGDLL